MEKVYLTQKEFDALDEYSMSVPTGVVIGKKWKRNLRVFDGGECWYQGEFVKAEQIGYVNVIYKKIVLAGTHEVDKLIAKFKERGKTHEGEL